MTTDRDFDRLARAWLDLMPDEAPDRTVAAVLQAVETTPQVRRPIRWLTWRSSTMNRLPIALGAAAVVVVAGTLLLSRAGAPPTVGASTSPVATTVPTTSAVSPSSSGISADAPVPTEILGRWMGDHGGLVAPTAGTTILFHKNDMVFSQSNTGTVPVLDSAATALGAGRIRLETTTTTGGCFKGNVGTYAWTRSSTGRILTITAERDDCANRSEAVAGVWWLMGCTDDPQAYCLGTLDAGTYRSQFIAPRLNPGDTWTPNFGALSYTVPDGWANSADWPDSFALMPAPEMRLGEPDRTRKIGLNTQPTAMAQDQPCSDTVAPGVARTVDGLATWLRTVPGLVTTAPKSITIDGHPGKWLDVRLDPAWTRACPPDEPRPIVAYFNPGIAISNVERERLVLLDLGGGDVIAIVVWTANQATFDTFIPEAMPIVQSFRFE